MAALAQEVTPILKHTILRAYVSATSSFFSPMAFPTSTLVAADSPMLMTITSSRITRTTELAAAAGLPSCPRIAALADIPAPHRDSLSTTGMDRMRKSRSSSRSQRKKYVRRMHTCRFTFHIYPTTSTNSRHRERRVARAAPRTPMAGAPRSPKIKIIFITTLATREQAKTAVPIFARSTLRMRYRYPIQNADSG